MCVICISYHSASGKQDMVGLTKGVEIGSETTGFN